MVSCRREKDTAFILCGIPLRISEGLLPSPTQQVKTWPDASTPSPRDLKMLEEKLREPKF